MLFEGLAARPQKRVYFWRFLHNRWLHVVIRTICAYMTRYVLGRVQSVSPQHAHGWSKSLPLDKENTDNDCRAAGGHKQWKKIIASQKIETKKKNSILGNRP